MDKDGDLDSFVANQDGGTDAFYRNDNYHEPTDTWQSLDYPRMAHVVTQVHQAVLALGKEN
jgi:hypothetical protein